VEAQIAEKGGEKPTPRQKDIPCPRKFGGGDRTPSKIATDSVRPWAGKQSVAIQSENQGAVDQRNHIAYAVIQNDPRRKAIRGFGWLGRWERAVRNCKSFPMKTLVVFMGNTPFVSWGAQNRPGSDRLADESSVGSAFCLFERRNNQVGTLCY